MQLQLPLHMNGHNTHCAYRGCMKPLGKTAVPHTDRKFYCDNSCVERSDDLNLRLAKERR